MEKILIVGWGYPPDIDGGLDIHVAELFEELGNRGYDAELLLPEHRAPDRENIIAEDCSENIMEASKQLARRAVKEAERFDLIHTHDWFGSEAGMKSSKYSDIEWISTFHSLSHQRSHNSSKELEKRERAAAEQADTVISVSQDLARSLKKKYGRESRVIHNGFSSKDTSGTDIKKEKKISGPMIFYVGRHAEQKGIEHLIYGFSQLERDDATLVIGGDGHLREPLESFTEVLGIEDKVVFTGFIPEEELGDYYTAADVFVSPSISEPFGLTVTESLEAGTPVVATSSGVEELLPSGTIIEVEPESGSIANGIERALERKRIPEYDSRTWEDMADEVIEIYRSS